MVALSFSPKFADAVASGLKKQTIRQSARAKAGQALQLYTGQRTKNCRKLADAICIDCTYVGLTARGVTLGDTSRFPGRFRKSGWIPRLCRNVGLVLGPVRDR